MKKLIIVGVGAFVAAAAVGTVLGIVLAPPRPAPTARATHDTPGATTETHSIDTAPDLANLQGGEAPAAEPPPGDLTHPAADASSSAAASDPHSGAATTQSPAAQHATPPPAPAASPARTEKKPQTEVKEFKQLAKILVNMKPAEAARVIHGLSDDNVHGLLLAMGPRQAASLLAELPPERAAALGIRLLKESGEESR